MNCPFDIKGYFEEYIDLDTDKRTFLGQRRIEKPDRPTGSPGLIERTITKDVTLTKGVHTRVLKASPKRPRRVACMIQILCGKWKEKQ